MLTQMCCDFIWLIIGVWFSLFMVICPMMDIIPYVYTYFIHSLFTWRPSTCRTNNSMAYMQNDGLCEGNNLDNQVCKANSRENAW